LCYTIIETPRADLFEQKLWDEGNGRWPVYYCKFRTEHDGLVHTEKKPNSNKSVFLPLCETDENIEGGHGGAADAKQQAFMNALAYDFMMSTLKKNIEEMS